VAALSKFIHVPAKDSAAMAAATAAGAGQLIDAASGAIDNATGVDVLNPDGTPNLDTAAQAASAAMPGIPGITGATGIDPETGNPTLEVHSVDSPQILNAGRETDVMGPIPPDMQDGSTPSAASPYTNADGTTAAQPDASPENTSLQTASGGPSQASMLPDLSNVGNEIKMFIMQNKTPLMFAAGGLILYRVMSKPGGRRKKGIFGFNF
jgi:hypothetical protein